MDRAQFETKFQTDDAGEVHAIAWPYGSADRVGDIITKGALSVDRAKLPMLFAHDQRDVIGTWNSFEERDDGLHVKGQLLLDTVPRAREVHSMLKAGAVNGASIGFSVKKSARRKDGGRNINDATLHEISIVAVPAHPGARVVSVKGALESTMENEAANADDNDAANAALVEIVEKALAPIATEVKAFSKFTERLDKIEAKVNRPNGGTVEKKDGVSEEVKAFRTYMTRGVQSMTEIERKSLIVGNDPSGGYLAPPDFTNEFIRNLIQVSPIRSIAGVRSTGNPSVVYPSRTAVTNAAWRGEAVTVTESDPAFGQIEIPTRELNTFVDVSNMLLADSGGTAEAEVRLALAEDFGEKEGLAFVSGDGVIAPTGLLTDSNIGYVANVSTSVVSADAMISLFYSLPAVYRGNGTWVMNSGTLAAIRQLKATTNEYLWQPSLILGQPETFLGRPVVEAVDMPAATSGLFPIIFGDFGTGYRIVDRIGLNVLVNPYSMATNGITRFHATRRVGAAVVVPTALKKLKMSAS